MIQKDAKTQSEYEYVHKTRTLRVFAQKFIKRTEMEINQSDDIHNTTQSVVAVQEYECKI